jgi:hypothetical protein
LLLALASKVDLGFGTHYYIFILSRLVHGHIFVLSRVLRVPKWVLLFDEGKGLTTYYWSLALYWGVNLPSRSLSVCLSAKLLLDLASTMILASETHGTHDHISLSHGSGSLQIS